ncbi:MAG: hypothetical protein D6737_17270 [Chloroflexi bacterium]|nr:MAG: hypothetical protein D6737_17270 [Chloroflexota bacterium]
MAGLVAIVIVSGAANLNQALALIGLLALAAVATLTNVRSSAWRERLPRSPLAHRRISPRAQEATERARRRGAALYRDITLLDIGVITAHTRHDGLVMRRERTISLDDDGVRPYIVLQVDPLEADRKSVIRFEMIDADGEQRYVHETELLLRDGDMNILADHQLPLADNDDLDNAAGNWDLRVYLDGTLLGIFDFVVTPSIERRSRMLRGERRRTTDETTASLGDLLRDQQRQRRN